MIELLGAVVRDAGRKHVILPAGGGELETFELLDHRRQAFGALHLILAGNVLPVEQEAQEVGRAHRLDFRSQFIEGIAMDARQQPPVAPFEFCGSRCETPAKYAALRLKRDERDLSVRQVELAPGDRTEHFQPARDDLQHIIVDTLERKPCAAALHGSFPEGLQQGPPMRR